MALPGLYQLNKSHMTITDFAGINRNLFAQPNQLFDTLNMSTGQYPYIIPREKRSRYKNLSGEYLGHGVCNGITTKQGICYVEEDKLYYCAANDNHFKYVGSGLMTESELKAIGKEHYFVSLGAYVLIFPEKKYFWSVMFLHYNDETDDWFDKHNLKRSEYYGDMEVNISFNHMTVAQCDVFGDEFEFKGNAEYETLEDRTARLEAWGTNAVNGDIYLLRDISEDKSYVMQYNESYYGWVELATTYIKISVDGDYSDKLTAYEGITIKNMPPALSAFNGSLILQGINFSAADNKTSFVFIGIVDPYYVANISSEGYETNYNKSNNSTEITISNIEGKQAENFLFKREIPDMDFVCELDARLWGCSNENKEVYASARGNPFSFNSFTGTSQDSYVLTVGSDGDFTGCCAYLGYVLFFKENCIHRMYGTKPTNYQLAELNVKGVQQGCDKSLAIANDTLYYKSKDGILAYQGSMPENISFNLGTDDLRIANAGIYKDRYYISVFNNTKKEYELFVFNNGNGLWIKEDSSAFSYAISTIDSMYFVDSVSGDIYSIGNSLDTIKISRPDGNSFSLDTYKKVDESFNWRVESNDLNAGILEHKIITKLLFEIELRKGAEFSVYLKYDNEDKWNHITTKSFKKIGSHTTVYPLPIIPRRCQKLKYKIEGEGECVIKSLDVTFETGSELLG